MTTSPGLPYPLGFLHIPLPYIDLRLTTLHFHLLFLRTIQFSFRLFSNRLAPSQFYFLLIKYSLFCSLFPFLSYSAFHPLSISLPKFTRSTSLYFAHIFSFVLSISVFLLSILNSCLPRSAKLFFLKFLFPFLHNGPLITCRLTCPHNFPFIIFLPPWSYFPI